MSIAGMRRESWLAAAIFAAGMSAAVAMDVGSAGLALAGAKSAAAALVFLGAVELRRLAGRAA